MASQTLYPPLAVIIPSGNNQQLLANCLTSLTTRSKYPGLTDSIYVVDTGYSEQERAKLTEGFPQVAFLEKGSYEGYASCCNWGVAKVREISNPQMFLFMNDDTEIMNDIPTLLQECWNRHPDCATVGPLLCYKSGAIQHAGIRVVQYENGEFVLSHAGLGENNLASFCGERETLGNTGACLLTSADVFEQLGGFREEYTEEGENVDYCVRAILKGSKHVTAGQAVGYHFEHQTRRTTEESALRARQEKEDLLFPLLYDLIEESEYGRSLIDEYDRHLPQSEWSLDNSAGIVSMFPPGTSFVLDTMDMEVLQKQGMFEELYDLDSQDQKLHILFMSHQGGCGFVRSQTPAKYLCREGDIVAFPTVKMVPELYTWAHMIVWHMPMPPCYDEISKFCTRINVPQVCDFDDNIFDLDPYNPARPGVFPDDVVQWMARCGFCTATRPALAAKLEEKCSDIVSLTLASGIDFERVPKPDFDRLVDKDRPLKIGWTGGRSHYSDLLTAAPWLRRLEEKYGEKIQIHVFGWDGNLPSYFGAGNPLEGVTVHHTSAVPREDYEKSLHDLQFDIGIIPLADTEFNQSGKSPLKLMEYASQGIPTVVQNMDLYTEAMESETALLAESEEEWEEQVTRLIKNPELRVELARKAYEDAKKRFDMAVLAPGWAACMRSIASARYIMQRTED